MARRRKKARRKPEARNAPEPAPQRGAPAAAQRGPMTEKERRKERKRAANDRKAQQMLFVLMAFAGCFILGMIIMVFVMSSDGPAQSTTPTTVPTYNDSYSSGGYSGGGDLFDGNKATDDGVDEFGEDATAETEEVEEAAADVAAAGADETPAAEDSAEVASVEPAATEESSGELPDIDAPARSRFQSNDGAQESYE